MIEPSVFIGAPTNFKNICLIYPPTVKEIVTNPNFSAFEKMLTITEEDIAEESKGKSNLSSLEFLLSCAYNSAEFRQIAQWAFEFFLKEPVTFYYEEKQIIVGDLKRELQKIQDLKALRILDETNYLDFQNEIRFALGREAYKPPEQAPANEDPRITAIKEKARKRDRLKAKQKGTKDGIHFSTCLVAICCMGIGITPLNIGELSYASVSTLMNMMQDKEKYDIDIRSLLAGADSKKVKPKYWIRNNDN